MITLRKMKSLEKHRSPVIILCIHKKWSIFTPTLVFISVYFCFQYLMRFFYGGGDGLAYDTLAAAMVSQGQSVKLQGVHIYAPKRKDWEIVWLWCIGYRKVIICFRLGMFVFIVNTVKHRITDESLSPANKNHFYLGGGKNNSLFSMGRRGGWI